MHARVDWEQRTNAAAYWYKEYDRLLTELFINELYDDGMVENDKRGCHTRGY